ncbi:MAG: baseplate J/gp47 family protein [Selenomonadaceae bacterium]|nr:baseplate J/gp47 family protein [Selenomonadaceae bacterium]MBQ6132416.1 baseplate J/gp47 family protein [Selenomonadaceae bacterium]
MSVVDFELPEQFAGVTYEKILADMLAQVPDRYDKTDGGFAYDFIAPNALECAEFIQLWLALALKMNFHMWATGRWLDYHAADIGLQRHPAVAADGYITVTTSKAVTFPAGFIFSVPGDGDTAAIDFYIENEFVCAAAGEYQLHVYAVEAGTGGNIPADAIKLMKTPIKGVTLITNPSPITGGTAPESDDSLRQRIDDFYAGRGASFVGSKKDYERWAREVAGVGYAHCIPTYDGANTVKIVISDSNGDAANPTLCERVEKYIFGGAYTDSASHTSLERLAPIGLVKWEVAPPTSITINISLSATLATGYTAALAKSKIKEALTKYFATLADGENIYTTLKYKDVWGELSRLECLVDFTNLKVGTGTENIDYSTANVTFGEDEMPAVGTINL